MRILIADGHVLFGEGLRSLLMNEPGFEVVGRTSAFHETIEQATALKPEVALVSANLAGGTGLDALREIVARQPECQVVLLTANDTDDELFEAFRSGARGYLTKATPMAHLLAALRALGQGQVIISRDQTRRLIQQFRQMPLHLDPHPSVLDQLTRREAEVLRCVAHGATNQEIARQLVISEHTVKIHVRNILDKLKLKNRGEAANFVRRHEYPAPRLAN
jgi:two-component system nitrate/nitrite response regulator NarL